MNSEEKMQAGIELSEIQDSFSSKKLLEFIDKIESEKGTEWYEIIMDGVTDIMHEQGILRRFD